MARPGVTSEMIETIAVSIADRSGYDAVSLSEIARALNVRPPSLYAHVPGKADLLSRLHRRALKHLAQLIAHATVGTSRRAALAGLIQAHRDLATQHPGLWEALQRPADSLTIGSDEAARVSGLMTAVLQGYGLRDDDVVHAVRLVAATINGLLALGHSGSLDYREPLAESSWEATTSALDRALESWPASSLAR